MSFEPTHEILKHAASGPALSITGTSVKKKKPLVRSVSLAVRYATPKINLTYELSPVAPETQKLRLDSP